MIRLDARTLRWALIAAVAVALRVHRLDARSLWFDEVISMRLAAEPGPARLVAALDRIDGSRAPLHPWLLQAWQGVWGDSSLAARALSAALGVATVGAVLSLGRRAWDARVGEAAAWCCAVSPPLVVYSQEVRMYALLILLTVLSWRAFLEARLAPTAGRWAAYAASLAALFYCHPLSVFMLAAHGLAGLIGSASGAIPAGRWLAATGAAAMVSFPWLPRYLGRETDYPIPLYPLRFLLGTPIEYIGGDSRTLPIWGGVILLGLWKPGPGRPSLRTPFPSVAALCWFLTPAILLYAYSWLHRPIFGQARYLLFIAPAYFLLIAAGLAAAPRLVRWTALAAITALAGHGLATTAYTPNHKADWRAAAAWLRGRGDVGLVVVHAGDPRFAREPLEAARYYLGPSIAVGPADGAGGSRRPGAIVYHAHATATTDSTTAGGPGVVARFHGLTITRAAPDPSTATGGSPRSDP